MAELEKLFAVEEIATMTSLFFSQSDEHFKIAEVAENTSATSAIFIRSYINRHLL